MNCKVCHKKIDLDEWIDLTVDGIVHHQCRFGKPRRKLTWKNQMSKSKTALKMLCTFLATQDKIEVADDLHPDIMYTYMTSTNGTDTDRCTLRHGYGHALLNIEIEPSSAGETFVYIARQKKKGLPLSDINSWKWETRTK